MSGCKERPQLAFTKVLCRLAAVSCGYFIAVNKVRNLLRAAAEVATSRV